MPSSFSANERVENNNEKITKSNFIITLKNKMINATKNHYYFSVDTLKYLLFETENQQLLIFFVDLIIKVEDSLCLC